MDSSNLTTIDSSNLAPIDLDNLIPIDSSNLTAIDSSNLTAIDLANLIPIDSSNSIAIDSSNSIAMDSSTPIFSSYPLDIINKNFQLLNFKSKIPYFEQKQPYNLCIDLNMPEIKAFDENGYGIENKLAFYNDDVDNNNYVKSFNNI